MFLSSWISYQWLWLTNWWLRRKRFEFKRMTVKLEERKAHCSYHWAHLTVVDALLLARVKSAISSGVAPLLFYLLFLLLLLLLFIQYCNKSIFTWRRRRRRLLLLQEKKGNLLVIIAIVVVVVPVIFSAVSEVSVAICWQLMNRRRRRREDEEEEEEEEEEVWRLPPIHRGAASLSFSLSSLLISSFSTTAEQLYVRIPLITTWSHWLIPRLFTHSLTEWFPHWSMTTLALKMKKGKETVLNSNLLLQ